MSENLRLQFPKLQLIQQVKSLQARKILLKEFSNDKRFCKAVREIVRNAVSRNIPISTRDKRKLSKYRHVILQLAKKQRNKEKSRRLIYQTGTGIFLPIVIPLVYEIIRSLTTK